MIIICRYSGVLASDKTSGFWLIHSVPKFPNDTTAKSYYFPYSGKNYGQTFLCISLHYSSMNDVGRRIAHAILQCSYHILNRNGRLVVYYNRVYMYLSMCCVLLLLTSNWCVLFRVNCLGKLLYYNHPSIYDQFLPTDFESDNPNISEVIKGAHADTAPCTYVNKLQSIGGVTFTAYAKCAMFDKGK